MSRAIGRTIKEKRNRLGLTQAALATAMGLSTATICTVETGRRPLRAHEFERLQKLLGSLDGGNNDANDSATNEMIMVNAARLRVAWEDAADKYRQFSDSMQNLFRALEPDSIKQLYVIRRGDHGPYKIGVSAQPETRLKGLQTAVAEPLTLVAKIEGNEQDEKEIHERFARYRLEGEWFCVSEPILNWIESIGGEVRRPDAPICGHQLSLF